MAAYELTLGLFDTRKKLMPYIFLSLAACFWGGNYVIGHVLVTHADPVILSEARWLITALLLVSLYYKNIKNQWPEMKSAAGSIFSSSMRSGSLPSHPLHRTAVYLIT